MGLDITFYKTKEIFSELENIQKNIIEDKSTEIYYSINSYPLLSILKEHGAKNDSGILITDKIISELNEDCLPSYFDKVDFIKFEQILKNAKVHNFVIAYISY